MRHTTFLLGFVLFVASLASGCAPYGYRRAAYRTQPTVYVASPRPRSGTVYVAPPPRQRATVVVTPPSRGRVVVTPPSSGRVVVTPR